MQSVNDQFKNYVHIAKKLRKKINSLKKLSTTILKNEMKSSSSPDLYAYFHHKNYCTEIRFDSIIKIQGIKIMNKRGLYSLKVNRLFMDYFEHNILVKDENEAMVIKGTNLKHLRVIDNPTKIKIKLLLDL